MCLHGGCLGHQVGFLLGWYRSVFTGRARLIEDSRVKGGQSTG